VVRLAAARPRAAAARHDGARQLRRAAASEWCAWPPRAHAQLPRARWIEPMT